MLRGTRRILLSGHTWWGTYNQIRRAGGHGCAKRGGLPHRGGGEASSSFSGGVTGRASLLPVVAAEHRPDSSCPVPRTPALVTAARIAGWRRACSRLIVACGRPMLLHTCSTLHDAIQSIRLLHGHISECPYPDDRLRVSAVRVRLDPPTFREPESRRAALAFL